MGQLDLIDIYKTFQPKTMNFTFLSCAHGTYSRIDNILDHKSSLPWKIQKKKKKEKEKERKNEIISSIFSDHNEELPWWLKG